MKALCLQLSIAVCAILSTLSLNAQLTVTCPTSTQISISCIDDLPSQAGDSLGFVSLAGAAISNVTGLLTINYEETEDQGSSCPGSPLEVSRTFTFMDESTTVKISCTVTYTVERTPAEALLNCDDVTVSLDGSGNGILSSDDVVFSPALPCPASHSIIELEDSHYLCNDLLTSVILNTLTLTNDCGEEMECTFQVILQDLAKPEIDCPEDITVDVDANTPCLCEANVTFDDAVATKECLALGAVVITRVDSTMLVSGDAFPAGITTLTFQAEDGSGNKSTCDLRVVVNSSDPGTLACKGDQNISLNAECVGIVSPEMLVKDPVCDLASYQVTLFDSQGNQLPSDTINDAHLGNFVTARASYECFDNYCSVRVNVEDKIPPMITCKDTTISCSAFIDYPLPAISDNCGTFAPVLLNQVPQNVGCDSVDIDRLITRTYGVKDDSGAIVQTCEQVVSIKKFDISEVVGPPSVVMISCDSSMVLDDAGNPDPSMTGAPMLDGIDLYPQTDIFCNVGLTYEDMVFPGSICGKSVLRTWTVVNWYCGQDGMTTFKQAITVVDKSGPEIQVPDSLTISSSMTNCLTSYTIVAPSIMDNCQSEVEVDIIFPGGIAFDTNSVSVELHLGDNEISFRASDRCGNMSFESYIITVEDIVQPIAVCEPGMSFSLDGNGMAEILATTFDNGSLDQCSDAIVEIARMSTNCGTPIDTVFGSSVSLCCEDIGQEVMVILRVTDAAENSKQCMTSITVADEISPTFSAPLPDITISNDYALDTSDLSAFGIIEQNVESAGEIILIADSVNFEGDPENTIIMDNCSINAVSESKTVDISMCNTGEITRTFIVSDAAGSADTFHQKITLITERDFTLTDITFPEDRLMVGECGSGLEDLILTSFPVYDEAFGATVSYTKEDDTISYSSQGYFTVERKWFVSDWCNRSDGQAFNTYTDTQVITVRDTTAPMITSMCKDSTICSFITMCEDLAVSLTATGSDNCTTEDSLLWTYKIEYADGRADSLGSGSSFTGSVPVGINTITWLLDDGCGNLDSCTFDLTIESCLTPTPLCIVNKKFYISPIDTSGDMTADVDGVEITASMVDAGSYQSCGKVVSVSFSPEPNDTVRVFTCDSLGIRPLTLFATDEDGRMDHCNFTVDIRDMTSAMLCGAGQIGGVVFGNEVDFVSGVNIVLEGSEMTAETDDQGRFEFPEMPTGGSYSIIPTKVDNPRNGVSSADLVLIQRHILNIQTFESPYKLLAADVNQSGNLSAADLITMRKLILGISDEFPHGKTWDFVPGNHVFVDPSEPWAGPIPSKYNIYDLRGSNVLDFIGVKLGDVNESVLMGGQSASERSVAELGYRINGDKLEVFAQEELTFAAFLSVIDFAAEGVRLESIESHVSGIVVNHYMTEEGRLRILLNGPANFSFEEGDLLLSIELASESAALKSLDFNAELSEIALENGASSQVNFRFEGDFPHMILKQNVPNPWVDNTTFMVIMPDEASAVFRVLDVSGKEVFKRSLLMDRGENLVKIDGADLPNVGGMYFYEISSSFGIESKKMMILAR